MNWDVLDKFVDVVIEVGIERIDDFNDGDNVGIGYFDVN